MIFKKKLLLTTRLTRPTRWWKCRLKLYFFLILPLPTSPPHLYCHHCHSNLALVINYLPLARALFQQAHYYSRLRLQVPASLPIVSQTHLIWKPRSSFKFSPPSTLLCSRVVLCVLCLIPFISVFWLRCRHRRWCCFQLSNIRRGKPIVVHTTTIHQGTLQTNELVVIIIIERAESNVDLW